MGARVMKNTRVYVGGADYSGVSNATSLQLSAAEKASTTYDSEGAEEYVAGLSRAQFSVSGRWNATEADADADGQSRIGASADLVSLIPETGAEGDRAFSSRVCLLNYSTGAEVGELIEFTLDGRSDGVMFPGTVIHSALDVETADAAGTAFELGALASGERLFVAAHILDVQGGGDVTLVVESAADAAFTAPTVRASVPGLTGPASVWMNVAGPGADTYWRVSWVLTGAEPSARFAVIAGRR